MTIADLSRRIELHFWDWAIPTLSASPLVQRSIRFAYRIMRKPFIAQRYLIAGSVALLGFSNGMLVFWLVAR